MKKGITVQTSNIVRFMSALARLNQSAETEEGMGILYGHPGEGKTTAIAYAATQTNAVYVRASVVWSVTTMLQTLSEELHLPIGRQRAPMLKACAEALSFNRRPVVVDEADYICRQNRQALDILDALRDLYDLSRVPVLLVGLPDDEMVRLLSPVQTGPFARFSRRISERVEFNGLRLADALLVAEQLCEVEMAADVVEEMHRETGSNIGRLVKRLAQVERAARTNGLTAVDAETYTTLAR
ncbi:MAG: ATP-binding protein [Bacteroidota bacterium]